MPDVAQVAVHLKELNDPALQDAWVSALADLAWFELYYANRPQDAGQWINGLKLVLPVDSVTVRRYQGWSDLLSNHPAEARQ